MGTRGACGFRKNGNDKIAYNHFDSYPECLGARVVDFCRETPLEEMHRIFDHIQLASDKVPPTAEQIEECRQWLNLHVSLQSEKDWYCLLHKAQGDLGAYKTLRYMESAANFIKDSLFCEFAYIVNLDTGELEFWVGFQQEPQEGNRYGTEPDRGYYPCRLVMTFPLDAIPENAVDLMTVHEETEEDEE